MYDFRMSLNDIQIICAWIRRNADQIKIQYGVWVTDKNEMAQKTVQKWPNQCVLASTSEFITI